MGDLIRGHTYSEGDLVTPDNLHALVENATIKDGVITTSKIADEAITSAKLASNLAITANKISLSNGKLLVGNASNVGAEYSFGEQFDLDTSNQKVSIKSGGITDEELAEPDTSSTNTYGSSSKIPQITVNTKGRITSVTEIDITGTSFFAHVEATGLPDDVTKQISITNPFGTTQPSLLIAMLEYVQEDTSIDPDHHHDYAIGDKIPFYLVLNWESQGVASPLWGISLNKDGTITVSRNGDDTPLVVSKGGSVDLKYTSEIEWKLHLYLLK